MNKLTKSKKMEARHSMEHLFTDKLISLNYYYVMGPM